MIVELEKLDKVSSERVDFIEECLRNIGRVDLAKKINVYRMSGESIFNFYILILNGWDLFMICKCENAP